MCKHTRSIRSYWAEVTPDALAAGRGWYSDARTLVFQLSMEYGVTTETAAGVVAALSQQCRWSTNIDRARHVLAGGNDPGGLGLAVSKAIDIREGADPVEVLGTRAFKIQAFYQALLGDGAACVIDTWMLSALAWGKKGYSRLQYQRLAEIVTAEAASAGLAVTEYQAVVWCQIRGASS